MELIGSRLGGHVDEAAASTPEFRREGAGLYFELRNCIDADAEVPLVVRGSQLNRRTIQDHVSLPRSRAVEFKTSLRLGVSG